MPHARERPDSCRALPSSCVEPRARRRARSSLRRSATVRDVEVIETATPSRSATSVRSRVASGLCRERSSSRTRSSFARRWAWVDRDSYRKHEAKAQRRVVCITASRASIDERGGAPAGRAARSTSARTRRRTTRDSLVVAEILGVGGQFGQHALPCFVVALSKCQYVREPNPPMRADLLAVDPSFIE
jgi:hypothetical protein